MSKSKKKSHSEIEHFRGKIKELEKENRSLRKQVKHLEKKEHIFDDNIAGLNDQDVEPSYDTEDTTSRKIGCNDCGKGHYEEFTLLDKIIGTCNLCGHRKRLN